MGTFKPEMIDTTREKVYRRSLIHELTAHESVLLATDYPTPAGRDFLRKLHKERPALEITLVNKQPFLKDTPADTLAGSVTKKLRKDVFDVLPYHYSQLVDIDLFGGLSQEAMQRIESSTYWKKILITFAKVYRHQTKKAAMQKGEDPASFFAAVCKRNGWNPPIMAQLPYRRDNKQVLKGIMDNRGPEYWTFFLERK